MTKRNPLPAAGALAGQAFDKRALIEDLLARCRDAAETCFRLSHRHHDTETVMQGYLIGSKLVKTTLTLAAALEERPAEFTHRIIVEHTAPARAALPPPLPAERPGPLPPSDKKSKTISGGSGQGGPQGGNGSA